MRRHNKDFASTQMANAAGDRFQGAARDPSKVPATDTGTAKVDGEIPGGGAGARPIPSLSIGLALLC